LRAAAAAELFGLGPEDPLADFAAAVAIGVGIGVAVLHDESSDETTPGTPTGDAPAAPNATAEPPATETPPDTPAPGSYLDKYGDPTFVSNHVTEQMNTDGISSGQLAGALSTNDPVEGPRPGQETYDDGTTEVVVDTDTGGIVQVAHSPRYR